MVQISSPAPTATSSIDTREENDDESSADESHSMMASEASISTLLKTLELSSHQRCQKVRVKGKKRSPSLNDLFLIQQLSVGQTAIFALKFSPDGQFLAAGCADGRVVVWTLVASEEILRQLELDPDFRPPRAAAIFAQEPSQILCGHEGEVVDLAWSTNGFLLTASTDASVRLWSPQRPDSLAVFPHSDIVTSVAFHPKDDRLFVSGSFDCRIRLWNVEERKVVAWNELPSENLVTAVGWCSNGHYAVAGSSTGVLLLFETEV